MLQKSVRTAALLFLGVAIACDSGTEPPVPASIELTAEVDILPAGQTTQLATIVLDESDEEIEDADVTFTSSNEAIATVNEDGLVTGVGDGDVVITAAAGGQEDAIDLFVFAAADLCSVGLELTAGEPVRASLQTGDCDEIISDGSFVDFWTFVIVQESTVTIEMTSDAFDAYLFLYVEEGEELNLVDENDNGGEGTDARIQLVLTEGRYWILANQFPPETGPQPEGPYTLTLTTSAAADAAARVITLEGGIRTFDTARDAGVVRKP